MNYQPVILLLHLILTFIS